MAFAYRPLARVIPASFSLTLSDLLHEGLTNIEATNYTVDCPGPQRIVAAQKLVDGLTTTPYLSSVLSEIVRHHEPIYVVWAYSESKETTLPFFVYYEGAFHYLGMLHPASVEDFRKRSGPEESSTVAPTPHYLSEDQVELQTTPRDASQVSPGRCQMHKPVFRVGAGISAPKPLKHPDPKYSERARAANLEGTCVLALIVNAEGKPQDIRVVRSLGMGLDEQAIEAARNWTFKPAQKDGKPVPVVINIEMAFRLRP